MEIQQHDGVVVEAAGSRQGFAKLSERERCYGGRGRRQGLGCAALPPPLYIGALGAPAPRDLISRGAASKGETCPPSQVGRPHPQGFQP